MDFGLRKSDQALFDNAPRCAATQGQHSDAGEISTPYRAVVALRAFPVPIELEQEPQILVLSRFQEDRFALFLETLD
jgi:hypothetical protein